MTWWTTERQRTANINPDLITFWISPVNLICKHLVTLFYLELKMNDVWVESFKDFISLAFKICLSKLGLSHLLAYPQSSQVKSYLPDLDTWWLKH
ncbi:hypothetical protein Tco_1102431 [Tanacetum coccineum]